MLHIFSLNPFQSLPSQAKLNDAPAAVSEVSWQVAWQAEYATDMAFYRATANGWHCNVCDEDYSKRTCESQHRGSAKHKAAARKKELALAAPPALDVAMPEACVYLCVVLTRIYLCPILRPSSTMRQLPATFHWTWLPRSAIVFVVCISFLSI